MQIPEDPLESGGIAEFGRKLRSGHITAERAVQMYLDRIQALDCHFSAFEFVAAESALATARAIDALLATGTDLGPLMGVPIAVKDIIAVSGMPTTAGSLLDVNDLIGAEGGFITLLRRAGCVILGKLNTVEFAGGNVGTNFNRKTPRNPCDATNFRATSGSSSGSAVAVAAGMCAFSIGSDTGGSIRGPAAFCGVVGLKPTVGLWPTNGVLPVSPTFDTVGPLTRTVSDAAVVWATLTDKAVPHPAPMRGVRLGIPSSLFFDNLDSHVAECMKRALDSLAEAGADIVEIDLPQLSEVEDLFDTIAYAEFIALFGKDRFLKSKSQMNPDVADLLGHGLEKSTEQYIRSLRRHRELAVMQAELFADIDAWVGPTKHHVAPIISGHFTSLEDHRSLSALCGGATRPANIFGLCATTQPVHQLASPLPVGLQLMCPGKRESKLLSLASTFEVIFGRPQRPDVTAFVTKNGASSAQCLAFSH